MAWDHLPVRPGHEIIGFAPGSEDRRQVKKFKEGDLAGVGCMVDSCRFAKLQG